MGNLFSSIVAATGSLRAFSTGLNAVQSNIANISTPGYARQTQTFQALPFDPEHGFPGGVELGELVSARNQYAESAVRRQQTGLGYAGQRADSLAVLEPVFPIAPNSGVHGAINRFFQSFSTLAVTPNSGAARSNVLDRASDVAAQFRDSAALLSNASADTDRQIRAHVNAINSILERLRNYNSEFEASFGSQQDPGVDANVTLALEQLSELVSFDVLRRENGSVDIMLGGQVSVLIGDNLYPLSSEMTSGAHRILDAQGLDVTSKLATGMLGGALEIRNSTIPSYAAGLDLLAAAFADGINAALDLGLDQNGNPPAAALFVYDTADGAAATLRTNALSPADLAAASSSAPGGNGNALQIARLADAKTIEGFTFIEYFGTLGGRVGHDLENARAASASHSALLDQSKTFRGSISDVSLDEEAAHMIQFQRSYEAAAKIIRTLDEMTETLVNML